MSRLPLLAGGSILLALLLIGWLALPARQTPVTLTLYCAASNRAVIEQVRDEFFRQSGIAVEVQYGASQQLLSSLELVQRGDLYLPADDSYLAGPRQSGIVTRTFPVATMQPVVAVAAGNPLGINSWDDLLKDNVRLVQANPDLAAIGFLTREALSANGQWSELAGHTRVLRTNVNEAANDVAVGAADAAVVYDVVVRSTPGLEAVPLEELRSIQAHVAIGVLKWSQNAEATQRFLDFLTGPAGQNIYREFGFGPASSVEAGTGN